MRRPILESGTAQKVIYLSKAPKAMSAEQMETQMGYHETIMRKELQRSGRLVTRVTRLLHGQEGDCKMLMAWVILGVKPTKSYRRRFGASNVGLVEGKQDESGYPAAQADSTKGFVPL